VPAVTLQLSPRAYAYVRRKIGHRKYGGGAFVSECLVAAESAEHARAELLRKLEKSKVITRADWEKKGGNVD
jgi:hypothetical protein